MREEVVAAGMTLESNCCSRLPLTQAARNPLPITHSLASWGNMVTLVPERPPHGLLWERPCEARGTSVCPLVLWAWPCGVMGPSCCGLCSPALGETFWAADERAGGGVGEEGRGGGSGWVGIG